MVIGWDLVIMLIFIQMLSSFSQQDGNNDPSRNSVSLDPTSRVQLIEELLHTYQMQHNSSVTQSLPANELCNQQYIVSTAACRDAGNGLGIWIDNLMWAIILNRTIVLQWNTRTNFCHGTLAIKDWIVRKETLDSLFAKSHCYKSNNPISLRLGRNLQMTDQQKIVYKLLGTDRAVSCCNVEAINSTLLSPGSTAKLAFATMNPEVGSSHILSEPAQQRYNILISNPAEVGSFEAYGILTWFSVDFTPVVTHSVERILSSIWDPKMIRNLQQVQQHPLRTMTTPSELPSNILSNDLVIALHVRHQKKNLRFELEVDEYFEQCTKSYIETLRQSPKNSSTKCWILIATDRFATLSRLELLAKQLDCQPLYAFRNTSSPSSGTSKEGEHGPWGESITSMADLYLLSHANYFIGTKISSYSTLIANLITARRAKLLAHSSMGSMIQGQDGSQGWNQPFMWGIHVDRINKTNGPPCSAYKDRPITSHHRNCNQSISYYNFIKQRCILHDT